MISLLKRAPELSAEGLPSVPKYKKVVMHLMEKMYVLEKFHSGMSYSSVDHEFNVNGSTIYSQ